MCTVLLTIVLTPASPEFEVRTLDGQTLAGSLGSLEAGRVTVQTSEGPVSLGIDKLMAICPKEKPTPPAGDPTAWIELIDGSSLLAREYTVRDGRAGIPHAGAGTGAVGQ